MLEALGQALGSVGGFLLEACGHGARDGQELGLDAAADAAGTPLELDLQACDRPLQAHDGIALPRLPPLRELDDLTHGAIVRPRSDISSEPSPGLGRIRLPEIGGRRRHHRFVGRDARLERFSLRWILGPNIGASFFGRGPFPLIVRTASLAVWNPNMR
jgi:hypothetical protein